MADISADKVKQLREATGAGMMDCKRALQETNGDLEKAKDWLRQKGMAKAATKAGRTASQGLVHAYIHHNGQLGVLVELNSESDFVARNEEFRRLAHELAVHIAAANPRWLRREDVPAEILTREKAIYEAQARELKRPENVLPKIVEGKLKDFYKQDVLLDQPFAKDDARTVAEVIKEAIGKLGENITISRFARFKVGESLHRKHRRENGTRDHRQASVGRPALQAGPAQAERGGTDVPRWIRHRPGHRPPDR
ncbi:MAG TPA: translation elongation factor Ts [Candidatus Eisenbacteria bacterium]|nr:translation elongation factor Ts [Candidatus Eisenbacteria bacterium]